MTRAKKAKQLRREGRAPADSEPKRADRLLLVVAAVSGALVVAAALVLALASRDSGSTGALDRLRDADPGPIHVHGLGVNPADGALFIATHTGLFRAGDGETRAERVTDRRQDTMGFTVAGPDRFLGSGHPDLREAREKSLPPHLGLISSADGGKTWDSVSLRGEADFHVLRNVGTRVYGYDATNSRLMVSGDRGATWMERRPPGTILDIAVDPVQAKRLLVSTVGGTDDGLFASTDDGRTWRRVGDAVGLLAWPTPERLYVVTVEGVVLGSADAGTTLERAGDLGSEPAAFVATGPEELYAALHDGTIEGSTDGGKTWNVRSRP